MPRSAAPRRILCLLLTGLALVAIAPSAASATGATVSLSGPVTGLAFCTPYRYQVRVISSKSYAHAFVSLNSQITSGFVKPLSGFRLVAHRPWTASFTETFSLIRRETTSTLNLSVQVAPPQHGYRPLTYKRFPISFGALPPATPQQPCSPPSYFGS
jgi:hypothetical protein